jgi:O-succinylbenzoic acid--CoA ligase
MEGVDVRIDDGVIRVRGATLFSGYFGAGSSPLDAEGWLSTDDLGHFDELGNLHVLGRRSDLVITGGENVYPAEVEGVLETCPGVRAACVFGVPDDTWGQIVAAAVVLDPPAPAPAPDWEHSFARFVNDHLAKHRRPRVIATLPAFDVTAAGKLDRKGTALLASAKLRPLPR